MTKNFFAAFICICFFCSLCYADTIHLKNGKKIEGKIMEKDGNQVKINTSGVTLTYYSDEIERVVILPQDSEGSSETKMRIPDVKPISPEEYSPLQELEKADSLPKTTSVLSPAHVLRDSSLNLSKKDLIIRYLETSGTKKSMEEAFANIIKESGENAQRLEELFDINEIVEQLVPIYDKYFTKEDLETLVKFYQSEAGRKLIKTTPLIMQDSMNVSLEYFQNKIKQQSSQ